ncbi:MAG: metallophosphoesterase family protein [Treponema sp.]|nr:metallophosphoesterase family protein [Treponema sp.]
MKLYISDLHFYHDLLNMQLDKRGFASGEEMNAYIIEKWNNKVRGGDMIIVLGDMFGTREPNLVNAVLRKLNGRICLIEGNHDAMWLNRTGFDTSRFEWIKPYAELEDHGRTVIASHYPMMCYNHQYQLKTDGSPQTYMLYGHVHNTHDERLITRFMQQTKATEITDKNGLKATIPCNMINCFCMFSDYTPLSLKEWIAIDEKRRAKLIQEDL